MPRCAAAHRSKSRPTAPHSPYARHVRSVFCPEENQRCVSAAAPNVRVIRTMPQLTSFDGTHLSYLDQGAGPAVVLLHGYGLDALGSWGPFEHSRPLIENNLAMFKQEFGMAPPMPDPPQGGRAGLIAYLVARGARVIAPDLRGFGQSDKPTTEAAYADSAMARDVDALTRHLGIDAYDVVGFSMGALVAPPLLALGTGKCGRRSLPGSASSCSTMRSSSSPRASQSPTTSPAR